MPRRFPYGTSGELIRSVFQEPISIATNGSYVWVADQGTNHPCIIHKIDLSLQTPAIIKKIDVTNFGVDFVREIRYDGYSGHIFACCQSNNTFNFPGSLLIMDTFNDSVIGLVQYPNVRGPRSITFDGYGNCFTVAENGGIFSTPAVVYKFSVSEIIASYPNPILPGGAFEQIEQSQTNPFDIVWGDGYLFWTNNNSGGIGTVNFVELNNLANPLIFAGNQNNPHGITYADGYVYWAATDSGDGYIMKGIPNLSDPIVVAQDNTPNLSLLGHQPARIAVDGYGFIYWNCTNAANSLIGVMSKDGSFIQPFHQGGSGGYVTTGDGYAFYTAQMIPSDNLHYEVLQVPHGSGTPLVLATNQLEAQPIVVDDTYVYYFENNAFGNYSTANLKRVPIGGGAIDILASNIVASETLAVDGANLYWGTTPNDFFVPSEEGNNQILTMPKSGGTITPLVSGGLNPVVDLVIDNNNVYFLTAGFGGYNTVPDGVHSIPKIGGSLNTLVLSSSLGNVAMNSLAVDSTFVYFNYDDPTTSAIRIGAIPLMGGTFITCKPFPTETSDVEGGSAIAIDDTYIYYTNGSNAPGNDPPRIVKVLKPIAAVALAEGGNPWDITTDGVNVYWSDTTAGTISYVSVNGGPVTTLASGLSSPVGVANSASNVYWTDSVAGTINYVPKLGGSVTPISTGQNSPWDITLDSTNVYWTNTGDNSIATVPLNGGTTSFLATGLTGVRGIDNSTDNVYWTTGSIGNIQFIPKIGGAVLNINTGQTSADYITHDNTNNIYWTNLSQGLINKASGEVFWGPASINSHVETITYSDDGYVWAATGRSNNGMFRINAIDATFTQNAYSTYNTWNSFFAYGSVWSTSNSSVILRWDPASWPADPTVITDTGSLASDMEGDFAADNDGYIWITDTNGGYVYRISTTPGSETFVAHVQEPGYISSYEELDGCAFDGYNIWVTTRFGNNSSSTIDLPSDNVSLPQSTIFVTSTGGFPGSGNIIVNTDLGPQMVSFTGISGNTFTGCSGGTSIMRRGYLVLPGSSNGVAKCSTGLGTESFYFKIGKGNY